MSRGPTKAQQALEEARGWIEAAKEKVQECEQWLRDAQSELTMHETIYAVLDKTFKRERKHPAKASKEPAKKSSSKSQRAASPAQQIKPAGKAPRCTYQVDDNGGLMPCDALADNPIHDKNMGYLGYHEFVAGKSAAPSAATRLSRNSTLPAPENGTRSTVKSSTLGSDELDQSASSSGVSSEEAVENAGDAQGASGGD